MAVMITTLVQKELKLELRNKHALGGVLVYVISTIFVCYLSFNGLVDLATWNALFWIILLFGSLNAVGKSFGSEGSDRRLYLYTLASPRAIIVSKVIYNTLIVLVLMLLSLCFYGLVMGTESLTIFQMQPSGEGTFTSELVMVEMLHKANVPVFILSLVLGALGFASVFTMISAIASQTNNNLGIMAILGFPVVLPMLLVLIQFSQTALLGEGLDQVFYHVSVVGALVVISNALAYLLFPYLWRS